MLSLTLIVPFYNEARTIGHLVTQIANLPNDIVKQTIFVDDGSVDDSAEIVKRGLQVEQIDAILLRKPNGGKASAIKFAVPHLKTSHVLILDADLELSTEDVPRLWEIVTKNKSPIVFGYRSFLAQSAFTYRYARGNQFISHFYGLLYNEVITDIMCGFKLVPTSILLEFPFKFSKFAIEVELPLFLWQKRLRPYELKVDYSPRSREEGKIIGTRDAIQILFDLLVFRIRMSRKRQAREW